MGLQVLEVIFIAVPHTPALIIWVCELLKALPTNPEPLKEAFSEFAKTAELITDGNQSVNLQMGGDQTLANWPSVKNYFGRQALCGEEIVWEDYCGDVGGEYTKKRHLPSAAKKENAVYLKDWLPLRLESSYWKKPRK